MKTKRRGWRVEAYTDESGHTGLHLFDPVQPWFWTGTLVSPVPIQERGESIVHRLAASVGVDVLHASKLGLEKIETIAEPLINLLADIDSRFVFTIVEKRHIASGKLADTVLDSTMNEAVSAFHYGTHGLRLLLSQAIVELTSTADQEEFWIVYEKADPDGLKRILSRLVLRLNVFPRMDKRLRELLSDALRWGTRHPEALLEFKRSELDAPNIVAFSLLMAGLHDVLKEGGFKVGRFVHDDQQQFGRFLNEWYGFARNFVMQTHLTAWATDIEHIKTYDCRIELLPSRDAVGLQLIDVVLWVYRRAISNTLRDFPRCAALVEFVDSRARRREHSREQLARDAERVYRDIMERPIDADHLKRARDMAKEIDRARAQAVLRDRSAAGRE